MPRPTRFFKFPSSGGIGSAELVAAFKIENLEVVEFAQLGRDRSAELPIDSEIENTKMSQVPELGGIDPLS